MSISTFGQGHWLDNESMRPVIHVFDCWGKHWRKPTVTHGEHTNTTQKNPPFLGTEPISQDLLAVGDSGNHCAEIPCYFDWHPTKYVWLQKLNCIYSVTDEEVTKQIRETKWSILEGTHVLLERRGNAVYGVSFTSLQLASLFVSCLVCDWLIPVRLTELLL